MEVPTTNSARYSISLETTFPFSRIAGLNRAICGRDWKEKNPVGTKGEFDTHFKNLSAQELQVRICVLGDTCTYCTLCSQQYKDKEKAQV